MDICLENPLDPPTDLKAFASLYLSYKQKKKTKQLPATQAVVVII